jgi:hypothetical protein
MLRLTTLSLVSLLGAGVVQGQPRAPARLDAERQHVVQSLYPKFDFGPERVTGTRNLINAVRSATDKEMKVVEELSRDPRVRASFVQQQGRMLLFLKGTVSGEAWYLVIENGKITTNVSMRHAVDIFGWR